MLLPIAFLIAVAVDAPPAAVPTGEVGYAKGSLAFDSLSAGDYATAEIQLLRATPREREDSAWLINYGRLMEHKGRLAEAESAFLRAAILDDGELVLADGREVTARVAARTALANLRRTISVTASR